MELNKCPGMEPVDSLPIISGPNLTMLIVDCKRHIFHFLDWTDLINLADTCKQLRADVGYVFQQKIQNAKVDIGRFKVDW